jgi:hypothetical protein
VLAALTTRAGGADDNKTAVRHTLVGRRTLQFLRSLIEQATDDTVCPQSKCSLLTLRELVEPTATGRQRATP